MHNLDKRGKPYRIHLRSPLPFLLTLSIAFTALLFVVAFLTTPGPAKIAFVYPMVFLFFLAYAVDRASLNWIRISEDGKGVVIVPSWFSRKMLDEKGLFARIQPGSELIFCRQFAYGAVNGYSILLRAPNGSEQVLWETDRRVSRRGWDRIANEIRARYQISARLITQTVSDQGGVEKEWTADAERAGWKMMKPLAGVALLPWLGIPIRYFTANPGTIVSIGVFLWGIGCLTYRWIFRTQQVAKDQSLALTMFVTSLMFVMFYVVAVLVTGSFVTR